MTPEKSETPTSKLNQLAGAFIATVAGLSFTIYGSMAFIETFEVLGSWERRVGKIEAYEVSSTYGKYRTQAAAPVIKFTTLTGEEVIAAGFRSDLPAEDIGAEAEIYYNPDDPKSVLQVSFMYFWVRPIFVFCIGIFLSFVGFGLGVSLRGHNGEA
jgi:hypothetical protein